MSSTNQSLTSGNMRMTRRRVKLAYIFNDAERKVCYNKRKKGLLKKMSELATLCDVDACCIIYRQYDPEPVVWPSRSEAEAVIARFRTFSLVEQGRKMVTRESLTRQRLKLAEEQHRRLRQENMCRMVELCIHQRVTGTRILDDVDCQLPDPNTPEMKWVIEQTLQKYRARQDAVVAELRRRWTLRPPLPRQLQLLPPPLPPVVSPLPPPPADELEPPAEESFQWNLVLSPSGAGDAADQLEVGDFGWVPENVQQENEGNNSNNFNDFNYFDN